MTKYKLYFERKVNHKTMSMIPQKVIDGELHGELWNSFLKQFRVGKKIKVTLEWED